MERRSSSRAHVDIPIRAFLEGSAHPCRAVDLSVTGMVFERPIKMLRRGIGGVGRFEIFLGDRPIRVRARGVWSSDRLQAVRFVLMHDADRLTIAEHIDRLTRQRRPLN